MSQCRSFGSNYYPSSQSKKISIGIRADQCTKPKHDVVREDVAAVPVKGIFSSSKVNTTKEKQKNEKVEDPSKNKQSEAAVQETSPWVCTRSFHDNVPSSHGVCDANNSQHHAMQYTSKQILNAQSDDAQQKKFNSVTYGRKGQREGSSKRVEEVSVATAQALKVPMGEAAQEKPEKTENKGNETLRMKIWEALGTVSTPTKQFSNSQNTKTATDNFDPEWKSDNMRRFTVKPRQNSDTIESDSDRPSHTIKRAVTRSSTRKRPVTRSVTRKKPNKVQQRNTDDALLSSDKHKFPEKPKFSHEIGWSKRINTATIGGSFVSKSEKKNSSKIEPRKLHFSKRNNVRMTCQVTDSGKMRAHIENSSGLKNGTGRFGHIYLKENRDSSQSRIMEKTDMLDNNCGSRFRENVVEQEVDPSLKNIVEPQFDFDTSTFHMKAPTETCFRDFSPENYQGKPEDVKSPMKGLNQVSNFEHIRSFKSFFVTTPESCRKSKEADIHDDEVVHKDSHVQKLNPILKETNTANSPSRLSEKDDSKSSDDGSLTAGISEAETPDIVTAQEPEIQFRPTKRCRISEGADVINLSPFLTPPQESKKFDELPSELNEDNGLGRAVSLLAMALGRVKNKMKSVANKRSAEILASVAMEMHLQLQNAESQIQKDVGKLTGIGKTQRRRLEARFQEQQEHLKDIYERFENEVNLHLQDHRTTLERLEIQQTEFKDVVEDQRASHGKIMLQAEEAIKTQLHDAERRITTIHKSARQKMLQLKYVITECLKQDDIY